MQEGLKSAGEPGGEVGAGAEIPERWSPQRKTQVVMRMIRSEDLETLSRELKVPVAELAGWREAFLAGGQQALKMRGGDPVEKRLQEALAKVGELTMKVELYEQLGKKGALNSSRRTSEP